MANKKAKLIYDFVDGIQGTFVDKVRKGVTADDPNLDNAVKIEYVPLNPVKSAIGKITKMFFGATPTEISESIYPDSAIDEITQQSTEPGVPERAVIIRENQHERQPWLEKQGEEFESSIAKLEKEKSEAEKEGMMKDIDKMESEDKNKRDKSEPRGGRRRNRGGEDRISDMF